MFFTLARSRQSKFTFQSITAFTFLVSTITLTAVLSIPGRAAEIDASPDELVAILRSAKAVPADRQLRASITDHEALVTTTRTEKATDSVCKIQAVLMARTLFQAFPIQLARVKVAFLNDELHKRTEISITKGDIQSFASGALTEEALLQSLVLTTGEAAAAESGQSDVADGFMKNERELLYGHIQKLKSRGTNVKVFMQYFQQIEDLVKKGDEAMAKPMIASLDEKLIEQEALVKQAATLNKRGGTASNGDDAIKAIVVGKLMALQSQIMAYQASHKPCPVSLDELNSVNRLVLQSRFSEAIPILDRLQRKL